MGFSRSSGFRYIELIAGAALGSVGALAGPVLQSSISRTFFSDPNSYLEGHYVGDWTWTVTVDGVQKPDRTQDDVFITTVEGRTLKGHGSDKKYGGYTFSGNIAGSKVDGTYLSDPYSTQPSRSGLIWVDIFKNGSNVSLKGTWRGIDDKKAPIEGEVTLTGDTRR